LAREITVPELIRQCLSDEVTRHYRAATSPVRADERHNALCRARFAPDFAAATDWWDLIRRLRDNNVHLREAGGGLALFGAHGAARLCKASDVGWSLNQLARRFRAPFPGDKLGHHALATVTTHSTENEVPGTTPHRPGDWPAFPPKASCK
jgi:hypothetical protein